MGLNGTEQMSGVDDDLLGIAMAGGAGYAVGKDGVMTMYNGTTWMQIASSLADDIFGIWLKDDIGLIGSEEGLVSVKSGDGGMSPFYKIIAQSGDSVEYHTSNLPFGTYIFYRMRGIHEKDTSAWSLARTMFTQASPELDRPKDATEDVQLATEFKWKKYDGASEYYFRIDDNPEYSSPSEFLMDSTSINYTMLKFGHQYYWSVRASHTKDISDWSASWWAQTTDEVILDEPENGEKDVSTCPAYFWDEIEGSKEYEIEVADNEDFNNAQQGVAETANYQCQTPMERKTTYYWRVRAVTAQDTSSWSATWSFTTEGYIGIDEIDDGAISIYPNPNNGQFNVNIHSDKQEFFVISVMDLTGKIIYSEEMKCHAGMNSKAINLETGAQGLYLISLRKGDAILTKKLFLE